MIPKTLFLPSSIFRHSRIFVFCSSITVWLLYLKLTFNECNGLISTLIGPVIITPMASDAFLSWANRTVSSGGLNVL